MSFDYQPILRSDLVELRPLRSQDYSDLYNVASDPLIWEQHQARNRHEEAVFQSFFKDSLDSGGALIATDARTQLVIGSSRFHGYNKATSEVEIGWTFLARTHWGGVYNGEMKRLMVHHALGFVKSVVLLVGPDNRRSQRAVEKIGGARIGVRSDGAGLDSSVYEITASSFAACTDH